MELESLPTGWNWKNLEDIAVVVRGGSPRPKGDPRYFGGSIPWIMISDINREKGKYISITKDHVTEDGAKLSRFLKKGTLILSNSGTICVPKILAVDGCIHDGFIAFLELKPEVDKFFLYHYLDRIRPIIMSENQRGVTQVNLNKEIVKKIPIPLPPLSEQQRIVARVEALLSHVNAAGDRLSRVPAIMKRFRQSVLAAACSGRLTEEWREENPDFEPERVLVHKKSIQKEKDKISTNSKLQKDYSQSIGIEKINENEIPESWELTNFGNLFSIQSGEAFKKSDYSLDGYKLFQIANVGFGKTVWDQQNFLPKKFCKEYEKIILREGDICIALNRPILGNNLKVTKISNLDLPAILYQRVGCLRSEDPTIADYTLMFMLSDLFRDIVRENLQGTDQPYLNFSLLSKFVIPLPPLAEQREIFRRVGLLFERADAIEREVAAAGRRCERLTQAVMVKAFSGRL